MLRPEVEEVLRKVLRVDPELLAHARRHLGTGSDQETVELALDLVVFQRGRSRRSSVPGVIVEEDAEHIGSAPGAQYQGTAHGI